MKFLRYLFNSTPDDPYELLPILVLLFSVCYMVWPFIQLYLGHQFNNENWALGAAALLGTGATVIYFKKGKGK